MFLSFVNQRTLAGDYDLMIRTPDQIHDEWLVLRCQSGQVTALTELLQRWHERLLDYARHLLRDEADASDALQETVVAVARFIRRLDDPAHFGAWARRILAHKCADSIRRRHRQRRLRDRVAGQVADRTAASVDAVASADGEAASIRMALDQLPIDSRALLVMRYGRDMSIAQMADLLHAREGTIKSRLHQARNELKSILERNSQ
jgi:RNA polymerase sigma-70 factor (ECF subfamily)